MAPSLSAETTSKLRAYIDDATSGDKPAVPGAILYVVDAQNNIVFSHGSGGSIPLSEETITVVHSLTKVIGAIAFMQLVERGLVTLDDPSVIEKLLPELATKKVLTGFTEGEDGKKTAILVDREGDITPRMLLNHSAGTGHTYFNTPLYELLAEKWTARNEASDPYQTILDSPLLWQPGTHTNYGQGLDWIAVLIERLTKQDLATYMQENIFDPLNLRAIGFEETHGGDITSRPENASKFWPRSFKQPDDTYVAMDPPVLQKVERPTAYPEGKYHTYPLGSGLATSAKDYARILTTFLNDGVDPISGHRILTPSSVAEITKPQLPEHLRNDSRVVPSAIPGVVFPADLEAPQMDPQGSFGLGCGVQGADKVLEDQRRGRSKGSFYWYSAANTDYWVDKEKGIVVVANTNYFPWNDAMWTSMVSRLEGDIYAGLEEKSG